MIQPVPIEECAALLDVHKERLVYCVWGTQTYVAEIDGAVHETQRFEVVSAYFNLDRALLDANHRRDPSTPRITELPSMPLERMLEGVRNEASVICDNPRENIARILGALIIETQTPARKNGVSVSAHG